MYHVSRRRLLAGAAGAAALVVTGCSSESSDPKDHRTGAMEKYGVGDQFKATEPVTFSIMMLSNAAYPYKADWPMLTELKKMTNVKLDATAIPGSDYDQKRSVMVSGGNAPMIIPKTYHPAEEQFISGGAILPVGDYLDLMPNFQDKIKKWNLDADLDQMRQADGKLYILPGLHEDVWADYSIAIRTDILDKLKLSVPETLDDLHKVLTAMKAAYPGQYPFSDRWSTPPNPGANCLIQTLGQAHGIGVGWSYGHSTWDATAGKFVYTGATDQYKQVLQYLNKLVSEKLLDPESFTQPDDTARQKFASGKSFVISSNAQSVIDYRKDIAKIPGATVVKIPIPMGPTGATKMGIRTENGLMISSKAKDNKNFIAMMQFIDWLWYSDEGQLFCRWGIQGTTYTGSPDDGTFKLAPDVDWAGLNPTAPKKLNADYGFFNGVFAYGGSTNLLNSQFTAEEKTFQEVMNKRKNAPLAPAAPLTPEEREQVTLWVTALKDFVNQQSLKFILGQRPFSEWDAYVKELEAKNSAKYIDVVNKAYERYKKDHG
jgi:putative aldouronate transport system substrate-binding protein